jgi:hypothetical protein
MAGTAQLLSVVFGLPRCRAVFLHVITYNTAAMSLYMHAGFQCMARLSNFYHIATGRQPDPATVVYDAYLYVLVGCSLCLDIISASCAQKANLPIANICRVALGCGIWWVREPAASPQAQAGQGLLPPGLHLCVIIKLPVYARRPASHLAAVRCQLAQQWHEALMLAQALAEQWGGGPAAHQDGINQVLCCSCLAAAAPHST